VEIEIGGKQEKLTTLGNFGKIGGKRKKITILTFIWAMT